MKPFKDIIKSVDNWNEEIFNYFDFRVTNAFVEGINTMIRLIQRVGRGYEFEVLRAKIMFYVNHKVEEKPSFGFTPFKHMMSSGFDLFGDGDDDEVVYESIDFGVSFDDLVEAINEGLL